MSKQEKTKYNTNDIMKVAIEALGFIAKGEAAYPVLYAQATLETMEMMLNISLDKLSHK